MNKTYLGAVCESGGTYGIVFLDFPGCVSAGDSLEEVQRMGAEALELHIEGMEDDGDFIPIPTKHQLADVLEWLDEANDPSGDDWVGLFPITVSLPNRPRSVSVPVPRDMIEEIAGVIERRQTLLGSREFIEQATRRELDRLKNPPEGS